MEFWEGKKEVGSPCRVLLPSCSPKVLAELRLMIDGLAGARSSQRGVRAAAGLQHRLSRRAGEGFCDLQASGGKPNTAQGKKEMPMRSVGTRS